MDVRQSGAWFYKNVRSRYLYGNPKNKYIFYVYFPFGVMLATARLMFLLSLVVFLGFHRAVKPRDINKRRLILLKMLPVLGFYISISDKDVEMLKNSKGPFVSNHTTEIEALWVALFRPITVAINAGNAFLLSAARVLIDDVQNLNARNATEIRDKRGMLFFPEARLSDRRRLLPFKNIRLFFTSDEVTPVIMTYETWLDFRLSFFVPGRWVFPLGGSVAISHTIDAIFRGYLIAVFVPFTRVSLKVMPTLKKEEGECGRDFALRVRKVMTGADSPLRDFPNTIKRRDVDNFMKESGW